MPNLDILAGPNGAGKTTFFESATGREFIDSSLPFINVDLIAKNELGGYTTENFIKAEMIYRDRISGLIGDLADLMIESNLAREADYVWIQNMKRRGYAAILYFIGTEYVEENIARVQKRVKEGGHNVPENIIRDRYRLSIIYLRTRLHLLEEVILLDNSEKSICPIASIKNGKLELMSKKNLRWVKDVLFFVK